MDLQFSKEHEQFREEVKAFLAENPWQTSPDISAADLRAKQIEFRRKSIDQGLLARGVPRAYGGSEQPPDIHRAVIISEEFGRVGAPLDPGPPVSQFVPTLLTHGTESQKQAYLPGTATGEIHWCQGYSEPGSGSDLASLQTRADLDGDEWVVEGQKIWTTEADSANMMYALVRTEPDERKHAGISYLLIDMNSPGLEVAPLKTMTADQEFSQVFFNSVRVPADHLVGERGAGWRVSQSTLEHERGVGSFGDAATSRRMFERLLDFARTTVLHGRPAIEDAMVRQKLAEIESCQIASEASDWMQLTCAARGESPGLVALMTKLASTEVDHLIARATLDLMGDDSLEAPAEGDRDIHDPGLGQYMTSLGWAIAAGSSNIQRNLIGEHGLGLPRDSALRKKV